MASLTPPRVLRGVSALEAVVQRDEGKRGIRPLTHPGQLLSVATELLAVLRSAQDCVNVVVLTGFPCLRDRTPPTETDGPPGAAAVARALVALGVHVFMPIEDHSAQVLQSCIDAECDGEADKPVVMSFPSGDRWNHEDDKRLDALRASMTAALSIERAGPAADGVCRTMRALPMGTSLIAPKLNQLIRAQPGLVTVAIGDGGNELGLGSLHSSICEHVPRGAQIGCVVPADAALVSSVSNWGGYALSHALCLLAWCRGVALGSEGQGPLSSTAYLDRLAPDSARVERTILAANEAGAVDGITAESGGAVDGMPLTQQAAIAAELREVCLAAMADIRFGQCRE